MRAFSWVLLLVLAGASLAFGQSREDMLKEQNVKLRAALIQLQAENEQMKQVIEDQKKQLVLQREYFLKLQKDRAELQHQLIERSAGETESAGAELTEAEKKLATVRIKQVDFRKANLHDVVDYLQQMTEEGDPDGYGVNMILIARNPAGRAGAESTPVITLTMRDVTVRQALDAVAELGNLELKFHRNIVRIYWGGGAP